MKQLIDGFLGNLRESLHDCEIKLLHGPDDDGYTAPFMVRVRSSKGIYSDHIVPICLDEIDLSEPLRILNRVFELDREQPVKDNKYMQTAIEIAELLKKKNEAYGESFEKGGEILKMMYPNGASHDQMADALCVIRIVDKLFRIATNKDAFGESPYRDICGYALLGALRDERKKPDNTLVGTAKEPGLCGSEDGVPRSVHPSPA